MDDERIKQIKEYLRLRKLEEEDNSDELIDEIYESFITETDNNEENNSKEANESNNTQAKIENEEE